MRRKIIAFIAMLLIVSLLLPSCAKGGEEETTVKETEVEVTEKEETTKKETTEVSEEETTEKEPEETLETMVLTDLEGEEKVYQVIKTVEVEGVKYVALLEASVDDENLDAEDAVIYRVEVEDEKESFIQVEDADELDIVSKEIFPEETDSEDTSVDNLTDTEETTVSPESDGGGSLGVDISISGGSSDKNTDKTDETKKPVNNPVNNKDTDKEDGSVSVDNDTASPDSEVDNDSVDSTMVSIDSSDVVSDTKDTDKAEPEESAGKDKETVKPSGNEGETKPSEETEASKDPSKPKETEPSKETSKPKETESSKETSKPKETEASTETSKPDEETEPSVDVTTPEETVAPPAETTAKPAETTAPTIVTTAPAETTVVTETVPETTYPLDTVVPLEFVTTAAGKVLVHTISDRTTNKTDDNSNNLAFVPLKDPNAVVNWNADQNKQKVNLATARPGAMYYGVLIGYDDYLFYKDTLNDFQGIGELATSLYKKAVDDLKARNRWVEENDMKFYFVIAPNKNTVYPDYMPEAYKLAEYRRYDQFVKLLGEAEITAVDLRETMANAVKANPQENLYYKYDTHWNNHAGYYAYRTAMDLIDDDFPNVVIHDRSEYQINYTETYMKDLGWYTGNYDRIVDYGPVYTLKSGQTATFKKLSDNVKYGQYQFASTDPQGYSDKYVYFRYTNEANVNAPNIYVMRDSYSIALVPFMKDSFYKSTFNWTWNFDKSDIIDSEADVVMVVVAERNLRNYVNNKAVVD